RFVVRVTYLNHPVFRKFLAEAEEEYGFSNQGPLTIPCDESVFEEVIRFISRSESGHSDRFLNIEDFKDKCHSGIRSNVRIPEQNADSVMLDGDGRDDMSWNPGKRRSRLRDDEFH
ncbi:hypothetical protein Gotri_010791, partial [Gossypium trilobum]|nr:hypothetical protein [Gossypium trilobum]